MASKKERRKQKTQLAKELGLPSPSRYRDYSVDNIKRLAQGYAPKYSEAVKKAGNIPKRPIIESTERMVNREYAWRLMSKKVARVPKSVKNYVKEAKKLNFPEEYHYRYAYYRYVDRMGVTEAVKKLNESIEKEQIDIY